MQAQHPDLIPESRTNPCNQDLELAFGFLIFFP